MSSPLDRQVAGDHYRTMKIQPIEFAMANGLDPCAFSILKYTSRHRKKNGAQDVEKAIHFVQLRRQLSRPRYEAPSCTIRMRDYCLANGIQGNDYLALISLEEWLNGLSSAKHALLDCLYDILAEYNSTKSGE